MLIQSLLSEFGPDIAGAVRSKQRDIGSMREAVYSHMRSEYVKSAQATVDDLHTQVGTPAPKFDLRAKWKERDLQERANRMADSVYKTMQEREAKLRETLKGNELSRAIQKLKAEKIASLKDMATADAQFSALVDQLVHTGAFNPAKDRVMYFYGSPAPCPLCQAITGGNPYTIAEATNYGPKAHPSCRDWWHQQWGIEPEERKVLQRRVRDGMVKTWDGSGRTPGPLKAGVGADAARQVPADFGAVRRYAVRQARRKGVDDATVDAVLNSKQKTGREKYVARKARQQEREAQHKALIALGDSDR